MITTQPDLQVATAQRYRCLGIHPFPFGRQQILVRSAKTGATRVLPASLAGLLFSCNTFKTLPDHSEEHSQATALHRKSDRSAQDVQAIRKLLREFVQDGFLVGEADIKAEVLALSPAGPASSREPNTITSIGIPTCNRTASLQRAVSSYADNARRYGRKPELVISDDSWDREVREENKRILHAAKQTYEIDIYYIDRRRRSAFARTLARYTGLPPDVTRFALLGDGRGRATYGAARNALLVHTVGECCLQVDDDTVCRIASAPHGRPGLALSSEEIPSAFWFFEDLQTTFESVSWVDQDFLGLHEQFLGKPVHDCIASLAETVDDLYVEAIGPRFLQKMREPKARIALSFAGSVGDTGMGDNMWRLLVNGATHERLTSKARNYRAKLNSRHVLKLPRQLTLSDSITCMTMNIGLDNRTLLPPFMPVLRNEDGVFSGLLGTCFGHPFRGYLPYAITHSPPGSRKLICEPTGFRGYNANEIILHFILQFESVPRNDSTQGLGALGHYLYDVGTLTKRDFAHFVCRACQQSVHARVLAAQQRLEENPETLSDWSDDVQAYLRNTQQAVIEEALFAPYDLEGSVEEKLASLRDLVQQFSALLIHWQDVVEAATELRRSGQRPGIKL